MRKEWITSAIGIVLTCLLLHGCSSGKYDRLPKATKAEQEAMRERFLALLTETKALQEHESVKLLHHFSRAAQSKLSLDEFEASATAFIKETASGKLEPITFQEARSPGKVRLLLIDTPKGRRTLPFVRGSDGWMLDDIELAFLHDNKEPNLNGNMPASSPSVLVPIVTLQDLHATEADRVLSAIKLSSSKHASMAKKFLSAETEPWPKTALLYSSWKAGGPCEPFAKAFPIDRQSQEHLYELESGGFRILLQGLFLCAASSKSIMPTLQIYRGCRQVEGGPRSEYVDPLVGNPDAREDHLKIGLANLKPEYILRASTKLNYPYEEDPVANIVVNGLHGEKKTKFYRYIHTTSRSKKRIGKLAKSWVIKMAKRDQMEPVE